MLPVGWNPSSSRLWLNAGFLTVFAATCCNLSTMGAGVAAGTIRPISLAESTLAYPSSSMLGISGSCAARPSGQHMLANARNRPEREVYLARQEIRERRSAATIGDDHDLDPRHLPELLGGKVNAGSDAGRCKCQLARIGLGKRD